MHRGSMLEIVPRLTEPRIALISGHTQSLELAGVVYKPLREPTGKGTLPMLWREQETAPLVLSFLQIAREARAQLGRRSEKHSPVCLVSLGQFFRELEVL